MGGIPTGGDRESYSVLGMGGTEQLRKAPWVWGSLGGTGEPRVQGGEALSQLILSPLNFSRHDFLNNEENKFYC